MSLSRCWSKLGFSNDLGLDSSHLPQDALQSRRDNLSPADFYDIIRHTKDGLFLIDIDKMAWHNILRRHSEFSS